MIVIAPDDHVLPQVDSRGWITGAELLGACATESQRLAEALTQFDAALGLAVGALGRSVRGERADQGTVSALVADLQSVDRLRQEGEALARILALVAALPSLSTRVPRADVEARVPTGAQRARLLQALSAQVGGGGGE